jgi:hypothetical protein
MRSRSLLRVFGAAAAVVVLAGTMATGAMAARPSATATSLTFGDFGGNGDAGFSATLAYSAKSTAARIYLDAPITGGSGVPLLAVTRNGSAVDACEVVAAPLAVRCEFRLVRNGEVLQAVFAVSPAAGASAVTADAEWSTTGYVSGRNNSHGDAWEDGATTAHRNPSPNFAGGFGNEHLATGGELGSGNTQIASLVGLPAGGYASIDDDAGDTDSDYPLIDITVNDGHPAAFVVKIVYPAGSPPPTSFVHTSDGYPTAEYLPCVYGQPKEGCFTYKAWTSTATIYLLHNGSLRRTS